MAKSLVKRGEKWCPISAALRTLVSRDWSQARCIRALCQWWVSRGETSGYCGILGCEAGEAQMASEIYASAQREA